MDKAGYFVLFDHIPLTFSGKGLYSGKGDAVLSTGGEGRTGVPERKGGVSMIPEMLEGPVTTQILSVVQSGMRRGRCPLTNGRHSDCMVCVFSGGADYYFGETTVAARQGGVLYLPKGGVYWIDVLSDDYAYIFVDFDLLPAEGVRAPFWMSTPGLRQDFERLYRAWLEPSPGSRERSFSELYRILARMRVLAETQEQGAESRLIARGVAYIHQHYNSPELRLTDAADACGCSEVHFRRLFRRAFGQTPQRYLTQLRIRRAQELLRTGMLTVTQTAEASGFGDVYYFCRVFRRETGSTPGEYRRG